MGSQKPPSGSASILAAPTIVALTALLLIWMPSEVRIALLVWTLFSFPIGILAGHCVLSED